MISKLFRALRIFWFGRPHVEMRERMAYYLDNLPDPTYRTAATRHAHRRYIVPPTLPLL